MSYYYTDQSREQDPHALPDVEVFEACALDCENCGEATVQYPITRTGYLDCPHCAEIGITDNPRWFYAFGFPGCLWDSDPVGPFETEAEALKAARESAGFCEHGIADDEVCEDCPAPELWVVRNPEGFYLRDDRGRDGGGYSIDQNHSWVFDSKEAMVWSAPGNVRSSLRGMLNILRIGTEIIRLPDADARRWGRSDG